MSCSQGTRVQHENSEFLITLSPNWLSPLPGSPGRAEVVLPVGIRVLSCKQRNQCLLIWAVQGFTKWHWVAHRVSGSSENQEAEQPGSMTKITRQKWSRRDAVIATAAHICPGCGCNRVWVYVELGGTHHGLEISYRYCSLHSGFLLSNLWLAFLLFREHGHREPCTHLF